MTTRTLDIAVNLKDNASSALSKITSGVSGVGLLAGGAALGGIVALGAGLYKAGSAGLTMNDQMEQATSTINAFTKDSKKTAEILEMVKKRAAETPFAFSDMAKAAQALIPSAKQAGTSLEGIIQQAEVLAASNPAQGLEGAAFALKEAVSGDFTSIIERFNLPRKFINDLKEQGVPNLEIVQAAMTELGLDTDLVSNLANTAQGRWSTFQDTLTNLAATVTQPIFNAFSNSLGTINTKLVELEPFLTSMAETLAGSIANGITNFVTTVSNLAKFFGELNTALDGGNKGISDFLQKLGVSKPIAEEFGNIINNIKTFIDELTAGFKKYGGESGIFTKIWKEFTDKLGPTITQTMNEVFDAVNKIATALGLNTTKLDGNNVALGLVIVAAGALKIGLNLLLLAIQKVGDTFRAVGTVFDTVAGIIRTVKDLANSLGNTFDRSLSSIRNGLNDVIGRWRTFKDAVRSAVDVIPRWLIPGSPTPFEIGLRGIGNAAKNAGNSLSNNLDFGSNNPIVTATSNTKSTANPMVFNFYYSPAVSLADRYEAEQQLIPMIENAIRGLK